MDFLGKQIKKEIKAGKSLFKLVIKVLSMYWLLLGVFLVFTPLWPLGLVFVVGFIYLYIRNKK